MNKLYIFLVLFFNLNFAVEDVKESDDLVFEVLDSAKIKDGKYKEFLNKEYLKDNFKEYGLKIYEYFNSKSDENDFINSLFFLTLDKNLNNLLNIIILNKNYIEWIETKTGEERKGYGTKALSQVIDYGKKNNFSELNLIVLDENLFNFYKNRGFYKKTPDMFIYFSDYYMTFNFKI